MLGWDSLKLQNWASQIQFSLELRELTVSADKGVSGVTHMHLCAAGRGRQLLPLEM